VFTEDDVLSQLGQAARDFLFADPEHSYYSAIDARLHVLCDNSR